MNEYQVVRFFIANGVFNSTPTENYADTRVKREQLSTAQAVPATMCLQLCREKLVFR